MSKLPSLFAAAALSAITVSSSTARAEPSEAFGYNDGFALIISGYLVGTLWGVTHAVVDVTGDPQSNRYAISEVAVNAPMALVNGALTLALMDDDAPVAAAVFGGLTAMHLATTIHGIHMLVTDEPPPALELGRVKGRLAPTAVSSGSATGAGIGFGGTF